MKTNIKRVLSLLLIVTMVTVLGAVVVSAAGETSVAEAAVTTYATLDEAIEGGAAAKNGSVITMLGDVTITGDVTIPAGVTLKIDDNIVEFTGAVTNLGRIEVNGGELKAKSVANKAYLEIPVGKTFAASNKDREIVVNFRYGDEGDYLIGTYKLPKNETILKTAIDDIPNNNYSCVIYDPTLTKSYESNVTITNGVIAVNGGVLTVSNQLNVNYGELNIAGTTTLNLDGATLNGHLLVPNADLTINGGTINNTDSGFSGIEINAGNLVLNGVTVKSARHAIRIDGINGKVIATIKGGTYTCAAYNGKGTYYALNVSGEADVTITDGIFVGPKGTVADSGAAVNVKSGAKVTIEGGEFSGGKKSTLSGSVSDLVVKGGTFDQDPSAYVSQPKAVAFDGTNYNVVNAVAVIGNKGFVTLADALAAAADGDTIVLISGDKVISMAGSVVGGKTITITGTAIVDWTQGNLFIGRGGEGDGKVIFDNARITSYVKKNPASTGFHVSGSKASDNNTNNGVLVIKDSYIEVDYLINRNEVMIEGNSTVTVYGGCYTHGRNASESADGTDKTATLTIGEDSTVIVVNENGMGVGGESNGIMTVKGTYKANVLHVSSIGIVNVEGGVLDIDGTTSNNGTISLTDTKLTGMTIEGTGTTYFYGNINFYGANTVTTTNINGSDFELIVNKGATLLISRFVLGYNRNITVYGDITDAHEFDPTGKTPSLKFNSTSGVSVGGTGTGNLTVKDAYVELGNSSWKNAYGTYDWSFENSYVSATSFGNNNAQGSTSAEWTVIFDDSVLAAKNYIKNGVGTTYKFTNGSVATTGSLRIDGELYIDATSSVTTTSQQNNKVGAVDEHGGINGKVTVDGILTIGSNAKTQLEMLGGELNIGEGGKLDLGNNTLTIDADSKLTIDAKGMSAGEYAGIEGIVVNNGTIKVVNGGSLLAEINENSNIVLVGAAAKIGDVYYATFEEALAAASADPTITRIEILRDQAYTVVENTSNYYDISGNLTIGVPAGENYTVELNPTGSSIAVRVMGNGASLTIEDGLTIKWLDVVADGFATTNERITINGTLYAVSLKGWTNNNGIVVGETGKVVLGRGDGQLDLAYGNSYLTIIGNGDKTVPQFKAGYSDTRGNGNAMNLINTYFEGGAWFNVNGANGTFNIDNSIFKISGGDAIGKLAIASSGNVFNLTNGSTLEVGVLTLGNGNTIKLGAGSSIKATTISGAGTIIIDATGMTAGNVATIIGDASGFTGTIKVAKNSELYAVVENGKIVLVKYAAMIGEQGYETLEEAFAAAAEGDTVILLKDATPALTSQRAITKASVIDLNGKTLTLTEDDLYFGTTIFQNGKIVVDPSVKASTAVFWMFDNQTLTFNKVELVATGVTGTYLIGINGGTNSKVNIINSTITIGNETTANLSAVICDNGTGNSVVIEESTINVTNIEGRFYLGGANGNVTILDSEIKLNGVKEGFYLRAGQALSVEGESYVTVVLNTDAGRYGINLTAPSASYTKAEEASVNATFYKAPYKVATKAELDAALAAAQDGDTIVLTADIDYGTAQLAITKAITLDLGGKTLTTRNAYGGMSVKGNPTIKNGTIVHASNTAAIKVWNATAFEDLVIDVQGKGDANKTIGGIVLQSGTTTHVGTIKNVTIKGAALTNGIETYNCGDATENVIGSMENVTIDAQGTGMLISAPCGTATNCTISGGVNGIEIWIKGNYSASLNLVDSKIEGGVYAHDEFSSNPDIVNNGTLSLTVDDKTTGTGADDIALTIARAENVKGVLKAFMDKAHAKIGNTYYATLAEAIKAVKDNETIQLMAGTIEEGTIKLPATLKNVTFKGEEGAILKDMTIMAADGNSICYEGLTFDGIVFENSRITITGWRTNGATVENLTINNCVFKNLYDTTNSAPVHINMAATEPVKNFTFTNNVIDGATGGSKSGIYAQVTGNVVVSDNVINNVSFRPYVIQVTTDDGIDDTFTVTGNTFSGSAVGRAQGLGNNAAGTDVVKLVVSENIFKGITNAQQICYWNFNPETTTADLSKNYYDIDILANPDRIYYNGAAQDAEDLIEMGVFPYYADEAMTQLVEAPAIMVTYPDGKIEYYYNMLEAVPYTSNCPRLEGAIVTLLSDIEAPGIRMMENGMVLDLNGYTYTITAGTGSQGTNTSGFQIRPEVTETATIKNGTIKVAAGAPVIWMFNVYATNFVVEDVIVDCANMAYSYGTSCYVVVSRTDDNVQFVGNTKIVNFNSAVAGSAINVGGTMTIGEDVDLNNAEIELDAGATLTAPEGLDVVTVDGYTVVYNSGVYTSTLVVAKIGDTVFTTLDAAFAAAKSGDEVKILVAGTYALSTSGKDITITGAVDGVVFDNIGAKGMNGANVTFNNVTFDYYPNVNYTGLQHSGNLVYNDCTFNGQVFLYGESETFNKCTFNQNSADAYNVWTYGAKKVAFNECTFNSVGKSVLIYTESESIFNDVTVSGCTFIANKAVDGKAAIEMDSSLSAGINLTIDAATTATGFGTGNKSGNSLWNNKMWDSTDANNDITVVVNGETVLAPVTFVAYNGKTGYTSIAAAIEAAKADDTVTIKAGTYTTSINVNKAITVEGMGQVNINGKLNITADGVTVKNLNINNGSSSAGNIKAKNVLIEGCTVVGGNGFRSCYTSGTVTFKDSTITGSTYGIHFDGSADGNIVIDNCVITGWTSFAASLTKVTIADSKFEDGNYNVLRFYQNAVVTNTTFPAGMRIDSGNGGTGMSGIILNFTDCSVADGSNFETVFPGSVIVASDIYVDDEKLVRVARIGDTYYETLEEALAAVADLTTIKLVADATLDYNAREAYGRQTTTDIIIDGQGFTLTLNQKDSDWSSIGMANPEGKLTLKNMTIEKTGYGDTSGAWNTHAINFTCNVEMNNVTVNQSMSVENGATLNNVTINEANGYYGLWIDGNGQSVTINGGAINATNGGRGIKIADQYIDAPKSVTLSVTDTKFNTAKKAAVLVSSKAGAAITASNVDITNVAEDSVNFVWVDEDWATDYGEVTVTGGTKAQESVEKFTIIVTDENGNAIAYYNDLGKLFADYEKSRDTVNVLLIADVSTNNRVYASSNTQVDFVFTTNVASGVTITLGYANDWNYVPHMVIGENVTLNVPYLCVYGKVMDIYGTVNTDYLYNQSGAVTVKKDGVLNVTTGDKTIQVKNNGWLEVYGTVNAGTVNVWNDNSRGSHLIVSGEGASLTAAHIHAWNNKSYAATNEIIVEKGATLTATELQADRGSSIDVDASTLNAGTLTLGYGDNIGKLDATNGSKLIVGQMSVSKNAVYTIDDTCTTTLVAEIKTVDGAKTVYTNLSDAIAAVKAGDNVITLVADTNENITIKQTEGINITLNGNGKTYSGTITIHGDARYTGAETLTIQNVNFVTDKASHYFIDSNSTAAAERYAHNVTVKDCSFTATKGTPAENSAAAMRIRQGFNIVIDGCKATNMHSLAQFYGVAGATISNVEVTGKNGISVGTSTNVNITNATIETTGYGIRADGTGAYDLTVKNSTITAELPVVIRNTSGAYTANVSESNQLVGKNANGYAIVVTAGDDGTYVAPDAAVKVIAGANDKVFGMFAKIADTYYAALAYAYADAQKDDTIVLLSDLTITETLVISKTITLDLNNAKLTGMVYPVIRVVENATVTVTNGYIVNNDYIFVLGASDGSSAGNLIIKDGYYVGETTIASVTKGTLTIEGGTFKCLNGEYGSTYLLNCIDANFRNDSANIEVKGGTFYGFDPKNNAAEGQGTSFMADGYCTVNANGIYVVVAHAEEIIPAVTPDCENTGLTAGVKCAYCGEILVAQTKVDALGHIEETITVPATCTSNGFTYSYCKTCMKLIKDTEVIQAIGHKYDKVVTAPTCTTEGYTTYTCTACGDSYVDHRVAALGHTVVIDAAVAPTCTATGLTAGAHCSVCQVVIVKQENVKALGHTETIDKAVAPTYNSTGLTEGKHCSVCGETLVAQKPVDKLPAVAAINGYNYGTLAEAIAAAQAGQTVTLLTNATGSGVVIDKDVTIDLNGFTYTVNKTVGSAGTATLGFQLLKGNNVTIKNGTLAATATVEGNPVKMLVQNYANLTLTDVVLDGTGSADMLYVLSNNCGNTVIEGASRIIAPSDAVAFDVFDYTKYGYELPVVTVADTVVVTGKVEAVAKIGTVYYATLADAVAAAADGATVTLVCDTKGAGVVIDKSITIDFAGFTYTFNKTVGSAGTTTLGFQILKGNDVTLKNGTLTSTAVVSGKEVKVLIQNYANLTLTDMALVDNTAHILYALSNNCGETVLNGNTTITTDAVAFDVWDYRHGGYTLPTVTVADSVVITGKVEAPAKVGNTYYATFAQAYAKAEAGNTITLLAPVVVTEDTVLDLSGLTIEAIGDAFVVEAGTLILNGDGVVKAGTSGDGSWCAVWANGGHVIINGGTYSVGGDASTTDTTHQNDVIYTKNGGTVVINGGKFLNDGTVWTLNENDSNRKTITVYGGTFENWDPMNNVSEGANTNFVAKGYRTFANGNTYVVAACVKGDVNGDGKVTSADVTMLKRYVTGKLSADKLDLSVADVNGDGIVNVADASKLAQYQAGLIHTLSA